jgi:hypothetical protein
MFVEPTVAEVRPDARQAREEIFGPVLSVLTVESVDEAIALANDTGYGLAASIFTANIKRALRGARAIRAGTVTVNSFGEGDITTPFGGFKPRASAGGTTASTPMTSTRSSRRSGSTFRRRGRGGGLTAYTARRLPVHRGPAAWNEILGPAPAYPALEGNATADVVIVGAGFAGLSAARRLRQLEPRAGHRSGGRSRGGGGRGAQFGLHDRPAPRPRVGGLRRCGGRPRDDRPEPPRHRLRARGGRGIRHRPGLLRPGGQGERGGQRRGGRP